MAIHKIRVAFSPAPKAGQMSNFRFHRSFVMDASDEELAAYRKLAALAKPNLNLELLTEVIETVEA